MRIFTTSTNARISEITAELAKDHKSLDSQPCWVFCEDKNTLSLETEIAKSCGGSFNITVTSLSRYLSASGKKAMSKTGSVLTVFKIMQENDDKLKKLKINSNTRMAQNVYELIAQLKSAKVATEKLREICDKVGGAFSLKLGDITTVYRLYEEHLKKNGISDNNNLYSGLPKIILGDKRLKKAKIIISGFSSVTKQILDCFYALSLVGDCDFVALKGDGAFYNNETYREVTRLFPEISEVEDDVPLSVESKAVKDVLFNPENLGKVTLESDKVRIFQCSDAYDEAENVAKRIRFEVVKNGLRYKDFCIATGNVEQYSKVFETVFYDYEIPLYADKSERACNHPFMRLIIAVLESVNKNYRMDAVFNLIRQRALFDREQAEAFERYVLKNAVSPKQLKTPFAALEIEDVIAENVRTKLCGIWALFPKKADVSTYVNAVKKTCGLVGVKDRLTELSLRLDKSEQGKTASFNKQILKSADEVLGELERIVGDKTLKVEEFRTLIVSAFEAAEVSILPLYNDNVFMGDFKSVKQRRAKVLFAVGLTDEVPFSKQDIAILTDKDLIRLDGYECQIEPKIQVVNKREKENAGVCLMSFERALYLSYPVRDLSCKPTEKSEIIGYLQSCFQLKAENEAEAEAANVKSEFDAVLKIPYLAKKQAIKRFVSDLNSFKENDNLVQKNISSFYHSQKNNKNLGVDIEEIVCPAERKAFDGEIASSLSASAIESYFNCPYSCFLKYNLRLLRDDNGEVESLSFGLILHSVLESFVFRSSSIQREQVEQAAKDIFSEIISGEDYRKYLNKPKYVLNFEILEKEAVKMCLQVYDEYKDSLFKPFGQEVAFGFRQDAKYPPIAIETHKGRKYLSGVVDRIDKFGNHLRIIDYKTGNAKDKDNPSKFYSGCNIQLYLYANAFLKEGDISGAYYYGVENKYKSSEEKQQTYFGKTVLDKEIILASDVNFDENGGQSPSFGIKLSSGKFSDSTVIEQKDMNAYVRYAKKIATVGANEMCEGNIVVSPESQACKYCDYKGICCFDASLGDNVRVIENVSKSTIVNAAEDKNDELD